MPVCCGQANCCCCCQQRCTILRNSNVPVCDVFGPFPDEPLLSSIDRVLYALGLCSVPCLPPLFIPSMNCSISSASSRDGLDRLSTFCGASTGSTCESPASRNSNLSICCSRSGSRACCVNPCYSKIYTSSSCKQTCCTNIEPASPSGRSCCQSICCKSNCSKPCCKRIVRKVVFPECCCSGNSSPRPMSKSNVSFGSSNSMASECSKKACGSEPPRAPFFRRSFSLCSLACRKLKQKLAGLSGHGGPSSRWLWTRMQTMGNGIEVYEVFMKSSINDSPTKIRDRLEPKMIFISMPNGSIIPFETMLSHK